MALQIYIPIHKSINDELFLFFSKIPFIIPKPIKSHKDICINNFDAVWLNFIDSSHSFSRVIYILTNQVGYTQKKSAINNLEFFFIKSLASEKRDTVL
jgi:hypothetical protein